MTNGVDGWPTDRALVRRNLQDATSAAKRLNHNLEAWLNQGPIWRSRCRNCGDFATVRPKGIGGTEVGGAATVLECRPTRPR